MAARFEYWKNTAVGEWFWHLKAANGEIVMFGEGYKNKNDLLNVIKLIQNVTRDAVVKKVKNV